ncbi:MAG: DNA ligase [Desulfomonile tiedjei]|nr:DNA ligase [Desulfomonile tiedjei]
MTKEDPLRPYRSKRDFSHTPEPKGGKPRPARKHPRFVIHKHQARNLHYDLRLEVDGVLKSWAVPKGPSTDPRVKRLAVVTEDHALEYIDFEGAIPEGDYGAGATIVWDAGTYKNMSEKDGLVVAMEDAIDRGHVSVWLDGNKLKGGFALKRFGTGKQDQWLLIKMKDEHADPDNDPVASRPESVLSGKTVEELTEQAKLGQTNRKVNKRPKR